MRNLISIFTLLLVSIQLNAKYLPDNFNLIMNLQGQWKFTIGDNKGYARADYDDAQWEDIYVPSAWENQGFPGYDGYAWYRKEITINSEYSNKSLTLMLGYIDDVDEVYFNGVKIGQMGSFPPDFWTAYNAERKYTIPADLIKANQTNTIAVRVYDTQLDGGILRGNIGIYIDKNQLPFDVNLEGYWKFKTGDNKRWIDPNFDDALWSEIFVPGTWEDQVSKNYDGFGWYRKQFKVKGTKALQRYVLILGKIDDLDEVYLNGKLVGSTGKIEDYPFKTEMHDEYRRTRYYYLNAGDVLLDETNTLSVRVFDKSQMGGIYAGPVGLIELKKFVSYNRATKNKW